MADWNITIHEDSTDRREQILVCPDAPYISSYTTLIPNRLTAPKDQVVALVGDRVAVYPDETTAKTKERDAITRLFDDQGHCLL